MNLSIYKALFRCSPYPYLVMDPDLIIIGASETYLRSVQRTEDEIVGKHIFDAFPANPEDAESTNLAEVKASITRALAKGEPDTTPFLRYSVPVETPSGTIFKERYWSAVHTPVKSESGELVGVLQNAIDVTSLFCFDKESHIATLRNTSFSQNQTENFNQAQMHDALTRILRNEREHLRSLFDQAPGFVAVLMGPTHIFELANRSYYQLVGNREIIGKPVWEALPEIAGQGFEELLNDVYTTGKPFITRGMPIAVQIDADGPITQKYIDLVYEPYRDELGNTIGVFSQGYDVTAAIEAEEARRESDERLRDGLDAAKMVVWEWDFATGELKYSDTADSVLGVTPTTMSMARNCIHPDDRERTQIAHDRAIASAGAYQIVIRFVRPDNGKQIWVDSRGRVRYDARGNPTGIRGVTVDVTERYQAELELREASERKDEFLAMLAHELRNPLAPISTAAEMLRIIAHSDQRVMRASEVISRQAKHMTALVDDLLDASRVTRGLVMLDKQLVDMSLVVSSAVEQSLPLIETKAQILTVAAEVKELTVFGDRNRLVQIITNLLNNAAKYTHEKGRIELTVSKTDDRVYIAVADNGIGIGEGLLPHIFDLFTQAQRTPDRSQGGLGIGLALVKTMVTLHSGEISAFSQGLGLGSKFTVSLPIAH